MAEFHTLLPDLVARYGGSKAQLARAIGITPQSFSRLASTAPSVEICLRLAKATGANPSRILRAAGRGDMARLLESLYGQAAVRALAHTPRHTPREQHWIERLRSTSAPTRRAFETLLDLATALPHHNNKRRPVSRRARRIA